MDLPPPLPPPEAVALLSPPQQSAPLVFASPHSGRAYSPDFLAATRLDPLTLRRSEDCFVDELFAAAPAHGAPLLAATFPRAFCDPNREPWELDPAMFADSLPPWVNTASTRVGAGLGTIARVVASGEAIYRDKLRFADAEARIRDCWLPFHETLRTLIDTTRARFGRCLLIDCHSMPTTQPSGIAFAPGVDVVLGDAYGTSCGARTVRLVQEMLERLGYRVRRNEPYAGGYITRHYGRPREGVEALQIELCRGLYMDEARLTRSAGFAGVQRDMTALIAALAAI
jgi:N-formylglutamate amidohydrolase